jgi:PAS domain S-box-containing protein
MYTKKELSTTTKIRLALIFFITVSVIGFIAYQYIQYESKTLRNQKYEELRMVAEAKHNQIVSWRKERLSDATMTTKSSFTLEALKQYISNKSNDRIKKRLIERLDLLRTTYQYEEVFITDINRTPILFDTNRIPIVDSTLSSNITNAIEQRRNIFSDIYTQHPNKSIKLDIVAPFLNSDSTPIAALVLRINPHTYLYPLIQSWPTTSKTSETVLVRRDSASIISINELRHRKGSAFTLKVPATRTDIPGVQAVLGRKGVYEGIDYRNIQVISDIRPIEDTPWFMVTKTDKSEIFAELRFKIIILIIIGSILCLLVAVIIALFYHYRQQRIYKQLFYSEKNLHETENEYRTIMYSIGNAVIIVNQEGNIKHMNRQAEILTGWSEIEAKDQPVNSVTKIIIENSNKLFTFSFGENSNINTNNFDGIKTTIESREGTITPISISISPIISNKTNNHGAILIFHDQTVERKAEKELMDSKERLAFALDGANDGLWDVEMDSGKVYLSPRACEILGYTIENIHNYYNRWTDLIHPQDLPAMQDALSDYFKGYARFFSIEQRLRTKQGNYKWILTRGKVVDTKDYSKPTRMVGTYTDITERKRSEEVFLKQEAKFRLLFENARDAIMLLGSDMLVIDCNEATIKLFSAKNKTDIVGTTPIALSPEHQPEGILSKEKAKKVVQKAIENGNLQFEWTHLRMDGQNILMAHLRDITERKLVELQVKEQERLIRETSELAKIGGWEIEIESMNGFWSQEAAKIFDLPEKVYLTVDEGINLFKPESRSTILNIIKEAVEQQKPFDLEFEIETVNKNTKWVRSIGGPVVENGIVVKVRGTYQDITDRKKAEMEREAIVEQYLEVARETENSRNKLNAVFNAVSDGIAVSDITGNFFLVNKAQALINGFSSVEEMQKNLEYFASVYELRTVDGDCVPVKDWPISKVLKGESVRDYELHGYRTDTKREWYFSFSGEPVFDEQGKQILAVIVTRDITTQMQTAIALKQQQDELQLLLTISQAVSKSTTFEAALQQTLELVCKTTRWDIGEAWIPSFENKNLVYSNAWYCISDHLKPFKDISHPYTFAKGTGLPGRVWMQKEPIWIKDLQQDDSFIRKTATSAFGLTSAVGIPILSQGDVISVMVFFITAPKQNEEQYVMLFSSIAIQLGQLFQRKKAEEALHESEERLRLSLTAAKQGLYDLNLITGETVVNKEYANMLGYPDESFVETNEFWQERLHPDDKARTAQIYYDYISGLIPVYNVEFRQRTKDGKWKWILSLGRIVEYDSNNRPTRMLGTHTDITDRKVAEQEILRLNESLEQKVLERTHQLEAANKELEAFSYSVSHDLKAPLRHINGFVNLLAKSYKETLPQEGKRYLNTIETAAQQMGTLIDDLLKLSRTSRMEMVKKTVSMDNIVNNALNLVLRTPPKHKIKWIISPLPDAFCDSNLLQMVWINLLDNAVKYTQNNSKTTIEIGAIDNQLSTVYFIRDNGVGFDMKYADKLFGVFQRLHTEHEFEGTGIGLANVNRIITRHGGKLWAEAELGKGATFFFILPSS